VAGGDGRGARTVQDAGIVKTFFGPGKIAALAGELAALPSARCLVVTDHGVVASGCVERVRDVAGDRVAAVFDAVPQDSGLAVVDAAADAGRRVGATAVVSVGGGSVIDTGKGVALALGLDLPAAGLVGINHLRGRPAFHAVVPTTAGTGSEATDVAVLRDESRGVKAYVVDRLVVPDVALLDPLLTRSLPPALTAAPAIDAVSHAVEAVVSRLAHPFSDLAALEALRLIAANLPRALVAPADVAARGALLAAAHAAGHAIATARVGLVHAMSHVLTARYGTPHGVANGVLLPHVMRWNASVPATHAAYARVAAALAGASAMPPVADAAAAAAAADHVAALVAASGLPTTLAALGVPATALPESAAAVLEDVALLTNPRRPEGAADVEAVFRAAWEG